MLIRAAFISFVLMVAIVGLASCGNKDGGGDSYPSATEDLGKACEITCYDDWCFRYNHPWCSAHICVGQVEDLYCSTFCLNNASCPEGYTCALNCDLNSPDTYCVKDDDYVQLIDLGICPLVEQQE